MEVVCLTVSEENTNYKRKVDQMKISPIKRTSALLAAMAIVLSYTVFPDTVIRREGRYEYYQ